MTMQPVAAVPIDADLWWIVYLRGAFVGRPESFAQGVKFDRQVPPPVKPDGTPNPRPDRLVVCRRDGGNVLGVFDRPRIALDVWAKTESDATNLAALVIGLAQIAPLAGAGCTYVEHISGPNAVADPSGVPRRLSLIEAHHRAAVLT